jgi:hypothetical protein
LREGEYQYSLAKTIASFQLELRFPDVRDLIKKSYGEERATDIQFIRKIQTILKKMERSNIVTILPKKKPWDLQQYVLSSYKFRDVDKTTVNLATEEQTRHAQLLLASVSSGSGLVLAGHRVLWIKTFAMFAVVVVSYAASLWALTLPIVEPLIFVPAFSIAVAFSLILGRLLSKR